MTKLTRNFKRKGGARRRLNFNKKRRVVRRGRKSNAFTSQSSTGGGINYRARKTSRRAYKKHLWNSTQYLEHYRSIGSTGTSINTQASVETMTLLIVEALQNSTATPFWTTTGGALAPDATHTLPSFRGDITLRGGKIGMRITNRIDTTVGFTNTIHGTIMLIRTTKNFDGTKVFSPQLVGWDPSLIADFDTYVGKVIYRKNFLLRDAESAMVEYRLPCRKFDQDDFTQTYNSYVWFIMAGSVDTIVPTPLQVLRTFNVSFSADAV